MCQPMRLLPIILLFAFVACTTTKYVPVESVRTEYKDHYLTRVDSIHTSDSVFILVKGDTVFVKEWHDRWRDRYVYDTTFVAIHDSIQVPYPVERPLSKWQQFKLDLGGVAFGIALGAIIFAIVWLIRKFIR